MSKLSIARKGRHGGNGPLLEVYRITPHVPLDTRSSRVQARLRWWCQGWTRNSVEHPLEWGELAHTVPCHGQAQLPSLPSQE